MGEAWAGARPRQLWHCWAGSHERREGRRDGGGLLLQAEGRERERFSSSGLFHFLIPFSFSQLKYAFVK